MNIGTLKTIAQNLIRLLGEYSNGPKREMLIDPALYAYLCGSGRRVARQHPAHLPGSKRSPRIDFRIGGSNPILIEFAVRPPRGGGQLYGSQNKPELWKLCRFSNSQAKLRALLLMDLHSASLPLDVLKPTYDGIHAGRGKFSRHPVQVLYASAHETYSFKWSPYKRGV